jgi:hypothetical protein
MPLIATEDTGRSKRSLLDARTGKETRASFSAHSVRMRQDDVAQSISMTTPHAKRVFEEADVLQSRSKALLLVMGLINKSRCCMLPWTCSSTGRPIIPLRRRLDQCTHSSSESPRRPHPRHSRALRYCPAANRYTRNWYCRQTAGGPADR